MKGHCLKCGKFLEKYEALLCDTCYREFFKWSLRRFRSLSRKNRNPIEVWLEAVKEEKK